MLKRTNLSLLRCSHADCGLKDLGKAEVCYLCAVFADAHVAVGDEAST